MRLQIGIGSMEVFPLWWYLLKCLDNFESLANVELYCKHWTILASAVSLRCFDIAYCRKILGSKISPILQNLDIYIFANLGNMGIQLHGPWGKLTRLWWVLKSSALQLAILASTCHKRYLNSLELEFNHAYIAVWWWYFCSNGKGQSFILYA